MRDHRSHVALVIRQGVTYFSIRLTVLVQLASSREALIYSKAIHNTIKDNNSLHSVCTTVENAVDLYDIALSSRLTTGSS